MKNLINRALVAEKKLFLLIVVAVMALNLFAAEKSISPTACGLTVGETTTNGKTIAQWDELIQHEGQIRLISSGKSDQVYYGDFVVEGLHMSLMHIELINDTIYKISFYENSPYADCWNAYKDIAFKIRDKYASLEDLTDPVKFDNDSAVMIFKTDGKTRLLFAAYPNQITYELTSEHLNDIYLQNLYEEFNTLFTGKTGPNYDEKNKVTSIAGVRFGETRTNAINAFKQRGTFMKNEDKITYFSNVNFGGNTFAIATLYFQYDSKRYDSVLASAKFEKNFYEWHKEEARMMYEAVASQFQQKYSNCTVIKDEEDSKMMVCGMLDDNYAEGKIPPIIISLDLGVSRGGDKFYYVTISYFVQRMNSAATDDI